MKVSDGGGTPERLTNPTGESHASPSFLSDGKTLLFEVRAPDKPPSIAVLSIDTGEHKILIDGSWPHVAGRHLVFHGNGALWAAAFDQSRLELTGTAVPLLQEIAPSFDIAPNGTLVYSRGTDAATTQRTLVWVDRAGREELVPAPVRGFVYPSLSPDGTRVAIDVRDDLAGDIWIWDFERRTLEKHTFEAQPDSYPLWTPDGRHLVFASARGGIPNIYRLSSDGTGDVQRLTESPNRHEPLSFSPDGTRLIFREVKASTGADLSMLSTDGRITPVVATQFSERNAAISPDGRWLAYESTDTGQAEIYVRPFPEVNSPQLGAPSSRSHLAH